MNIAISRARRFTALLLMSSATLGLGACTATATVPQMPEGIHISVYQSRLDLAARHLEVRVTNNTGEKLTVKRLEFQSEQFVSPAKWKKDSTSIASGVAADLPVALEEPRCDGVDLRPLVTIDYELAEGRKGTATVEAKDLNDRLPTLMREECFAQSIKDIVTIELKTLPSTRQVDGQLLADLPLSLTPTGKKGTVRIENARGTVLIAVADPNTGQVLTEQSLNTTFASGDEATTATLVLRPNRCDVHAVAEDKRGTVFPLWISVNGGQPGVVFVASTDDVRGALYAFVAAACGR